MKSNKYITKEEEKTAFKKAFRHANGHMILGFSVFFVMFVYLVFVIMNFALTKKNHYTFAEFGQIVESEVFTGVVVRQETVYYANQSGPIHYFALEGEKMRQDALICLIDNQRVLTNSIDLSSEIIWTQTEYDMIQTQFNAYIQEETFLKTAFSDSHQNHVLNTILNLYTSKQLDRSIQQVRYLENIYDLQDYALYTLPKAGIISYYVDGFEDLTQLDVMPPSKAEDYQPTYTLVNQVKAGDPLYKVIDHYTWYLIAEVSQDFYQFAQNKSHIPIRILTNGLLVDAELEACYLSEGRYYARFVFDRYLDHFITDRFVDFSVIYEAYDGLKIPNSAVLTQSFVAIDRRAIVESHGRTGVNVVTKSLNNDNAIDFRFVPINFYYVRGDYAYIAMQDSITLADTLMFQDGEHRIELDLSRQPTENHEGVYMINRGYAAFRLIETIAYKEDYRIIATNTRNGVRMYDRIASDASAMKTNELIYK